MVFDLKRMFQLFSEVAPLLRWNSNISQHWMNSGFSVSFHSHSNCSRLYLPEPWPANALPRPRVSTHTDHWAPSEEVLLLQYSTKFCQPQTPITASPLSKNTASLGFMIRKVSWAQEPRQTNVFLFAQESRSYSVYCLTPVNSCLIYSVVFYSCLWREDYSVVAGSANDSPYCFSFRESQPHTGMLMTKCLHLITAHSKKTFWTPDKSITSFSLRGDYMLYLLVASESFLTAA